jgi:ABC-type transport system involved in multi-copper enzyme maturation permease subunit
VKPRGWHKFLDTLRTRLSMPLLGKELTETAARRRTYILRVVYAVLLFLIFWFTMPRGMFYGSNGGANLGYRLLGFGRQLFEQLTIIQVFGVLLFQPALMCARITQEKERDSLVLLFLTKLRPWEIVLQKYLGGLIPMLSFLLLGLPLAGVAYAFGGVESHVLVQNISGLLLLTLQVGALALLCSAWCRTTVSALISSYVAGLTFYLGPPLLGQLLWSIRRTFNPSLGYDYEAAQYRFLLIPQAAIEFCTRSRPHSYWVLAPSILSIFVLLLLTRLFLVRRAFLPPFDLLPRIFRWVDRFMKWANRFVGGVVLYRDGGSLPVDEPIFWRETQRRVLGKPHYLFRLLCFLEIPTVLLCILVVLGDSSSSSSLSVTAFILGALAMFTLSATAANSIVSERVGQTLEVLLTTPLKATQIIRQKERSLRRLEWILAVPLITIFASRAFLMGGEYSRGYKDWVPYLTFSTLAVVIYLPMITWLSLWIGLRVRTRFQAILAALGTLSAWMALAPVLTVMIDNNSERHSRWWLLVSPVGLPALNEFDRLPDVGDFNSPWPAIITNVVLYTIIALFIRWMLFRDAERCLRR